jgi:hypothetical protein
MAFMLQCAIKHTESSMKADIWNELYRIVKDLSKRLPRGSRRVPDWLIVLTFLWAALNDSPVSWAVQRRHWPLWCQRIIKRVPSSTTMSRRLRRPGVLAFLSAVLEEAQKDLPVTLYRTIDGKPLVIGGGSGDRHGRYGRAVGGKARGYKLHLLLDSSEKILAWRIAGMNEPEQEMAARLLRDAQGAGYCLADSNYNSNELFGRARQHDLQLVARRRRRGKGGKRKGRHAHDPARLRSMELTEGPSEFGRSLLHERDAIERYLGNLTSFGGGLGPLPAWVRTWPRVHRWVSAKLAINAVRMLLRRKRRAA